MYYIKYKYCEVIVTDSNQHQETMAIKRRPRASLAVNHRSAVKPSLNSTVLTRKQPAMVSRPVAQSVSATSQRQMVASQTMNVASQQPVTATQQVVATAQPMSTPQSTDVVAQSVMMQQAQMQQQQYQQQQSVAATQSPTGKEMKESAIQKALKAVSKSSKKEKKSFGSVHFGFKRILLAAACASVAVFAIVYFVNINAPNVSLKVAAMQSGIDASYPSYVPRDFNLTDITSESGRITISFKNSITGCSFSLLEEKTSWDSNALLNNYVKDNIPFYSTIKEQGLTIYMSDSISAWVNNGISYKLKVTAGSLTKKQIKSIAVSL